MVVTEECDGVREKCRSLDLDTHGQMGDLRQGNVQRHIAQEFSKGKSADRRVYSPSGVGSNELVTLHKIMVHFRRGSPWLLMHPFGSRLFDAPPIQCFAQDGFACERRLDHCHYGSRWK